MVIIEPEPIQRYMEVHLQKNLMVSALLTFLLHSFCEGDEDEIDDCTSSVHCVCCEQIT